MVEKIDKDRGIFAFCAGGMQATKGCIPENASLVSKPASFATSLAGEPFQIR